MKWKIFLTTCASTFLISFPYNIIGCGGGEVDAYDYYTSFFNPDISSTKALRPFFYTAYGNMYYVEEPVSPNDIIATEWKEYCGNNVSTKDAKAFVMEYALKDVSNLYFNIEKNKKNVIPDSVQRNNMSNYFTQQKDFEALGYIMYAKKVEPLVANNQYNWEAKVNDSIGMAKLIKNGIQLHAAAKKDFFKLKYAYQITKLAMYSGNNTDAIKYYDDLITTNKTQSILQPLSLAIKAGALFRTGREKEAAYLYSKAFAATDAKKVSNYVSFSWATQKTDSRDEYLKFCKTNEERANLLALFALNSGANEINTVEEINKLDANNKSIETLIAREINKTEESFLSPLLEKQNGGKIFYNSWNSIEKDSIFNKTGKELKNLTNKLIKMAADKKTNAALFETAAAYCALMQADFSNANKYLAVAKTMSPNTKVNDQWMLTNLLLNINEYDKLDATAEEKLLPAVKWLQQKAKTEVAIAGDWNRFSPWKNFYRNIMTVALAKKYHAQGDIYKETLCVGAADRILGKENNYGSLDFLRTKTDIKDIEKLYALMTNANASNFESFLIKNNALSKDNIIDFAGTAYLRNYDYDNAIKWLSKSDSKNIVIEKSAFIELLDDRIERLPNEKRTTTKLAFAKEMAEAKKLAETDKTTAAKSYYKMATGMYNITYYGHAWQLVQFYRSTVDGYAIPKDATNFEKEYYGCYAAHDMFKKAMNTSVDRNFKAKCLFMMAKCSQKTAARRYGYMEPDYTYEKAEAAEKAFWPLFKNNKYFPTLIKEYKDTKFYEEAFSSCSYLRDFELKNK
jgi:hypothetical protein